MDDILLLQNIIVTEIIVCGRCVDNGYSKHTTLIQIGDLKSIMYTGTDFHSILVYYKS